MADSKYSALTSVALGVRAADVFALAQAGTSYAATVSSVTQASVSTGVLFNDQWPVQPASTATGTMLIYGMNIAGQMRLNTVGEYGDDRPMQRSLFNDSMFIWYGNSSAPGTALGGIATNIGSFSSAAPVMGSPYSTRRRATYSSTTAGVSTVQAGITSANNDYWNTSTSGYGGYFFFARMGLESYSSASRFFVGMTPTASNVICSTDPTSMINSVGFAINLASSSWSFIHSSNGTASSETILGQSALSSNANAAGKIGYDFYIFSPPINTNVIYYRMDEMNTMSTLVNASVTTHLPSNTSFVKGAIMSGSSTNAIKIGIIKMYIETTI